MLYLALSCFQGRRMSDAAETLAALAPGQVGLQLTAGCAPSRITVTCPMRTHHGFSYQALRAKVWEDGKLLWHGDSAHPPKQGMVPENWQPPDNVVLETMYPGYAALANGDQLAAAMDAGRSLAVDIAHLGVQLHHGILTQPTLRRLLDYPRIAEVHVSTSHDGRDTHAKLADTTWGLEWARAQLARDTPVILECYMHKLSHEERLEQIALLS